MIPYIDTSVFISAVTAEIDSRRTRAWLAQQQDAGIGISDWCVTEISAALSVKIRRGEITADQRATALFLLADMIQTSLTVLPVSKGHFVHAARLADDFALGLRAGDALHIAIASANKLEIYTLDKRLAAAGAACGVVTHLI